jgi:hypothetical protein
MSISQQLAAETSETVLSLMKGWSHQDYNLFVEALVTFADERDVSFLLCWNLLILLFSQVE